MVDRKEIYKVIGINSDGEVIMLDRLCRDDKDRTWAVGSVFRPVTQDQVDEYQDPEYIKDCMDGEYLWQEAVSNGRTEASLDDFCRDLTLIAKTEGQMYFGHDTSYIEHIAEDFRREYFPEAVTFECIGGGRCLPDDNLEIIIDQELIDLVNEYENGSF